MDPKLFFLLDGLLYPSESDEPLQFVSQTRFQDGKITPGELAELFGLGADEAIIERDPEHFWSPVTTEQEWHGVEERNRNAQFLEIRHILEQGLTDLQYFEAGAVEVGLYVLGQSEGKIMGIKTTAVRT